MVEAFYDLGAGTSFIIALVVGSMMFWWLLQHEVVFNPTLYGYFIQWATCVGGVFVALLLLVGVVGGVISWIADFVGNHYKLLLGIVVVVIGLGAYGGKNKKEQDISESTDGNVSTLKEKSDNTVNSEEKMVTSSVAADVESAENLGNQYCQHCGAKLDPSDKFCGNCGSSVQ